MKYRNSESTPYRKKHERYRHMDDENFIELLNERCDIEGFYNSYSSFSSRLAKNLIPSMKCLLEFMNTAPIQDIFNHEDYNKYLLERIKESESYCKDIESTKMAEIELLKNENRSLNEKLKSLKEIIGN